MRQRLQHIRHAPALSRQRRRARGFVDAGEDFVDEDDVVGWACGAFDGGVGLEVEVPGAVDDEAGFRVAVAVARGLGVGFGRGEEAGVVAFSDDDEGEAW